MTRLALALLVLCVGCYERTLIVADPDSDEAPDGSLGASDDDDDAATDPPPAVDDDPPSLEGGTATEDAATTAEGGRDGRRCRICRIRLPECGPPRDGNNNWDCYECGCCESQEQCRAIEPSANLMCVGLRGDGVGICLPIWNGTPPLP